MQKINLELSKNRDASDCKEAAISDQASADRISTVGVRWRAAMLAGDFEAAWRETDRIEIPRRLMSHQSWFNPEPHQLVWSGQSFDGRCVLIRCEHGLGDTLQFLRYARRVQSIARKVFIRVQPPLLSLLEGMDGADAIFDGWTNEAAPQHDVAVECMELPYAFRDSAETIPDANYLSLERLLQKPPLAEITGHRKAGIIWASSSWDPSRSLNLSEFKTLFEIPHIHFIGLQQGPACNEVHESGLPITMVSPLTCDIADAARAILQMDLIITVDGMMAHLAGTLGVPVWLILKYDADWRWMQQTDRSIWYPTMHLFRRSREDETWVGVIERIRNALLNLKPGG